MTKTFPVHVVAGLTTGMSLGSFGDIHECAEFVLGHPIWTHEFADPSLGAKCRERIFALHPKLVEADALVAPLNRENFKVEGPKVIATLAERFGVMLDITQGVEARVEDPISSFQRIAPGKPVIVATIEEG
jgi:hypothetical protein